MNLEYTECNRAVLSMLDAMEATVKAIKSINAAANVLPIEEGIVKLYEEIEKDK